jgi:dolichol-phosphate mannosyltransferase
MPAYNEGLHIYDNLAETHRVLKKTKRGFEIILIDDGSKDNTFIEGKRMADDLGNIIPVKMGRNGGKGNALKEGFPETASSFKGRYA